MDKKSLRELVKEKRAKLSQNYVNESSEKIWDNLYNKDIFKNSKVILSYMSFKNEVDTSSFNENVIKSGRILLLPRVKNSCEMEIIKYSGKFSINKFGIKEPIGEVYKGNIDIVIVPGVVFDKNGNRIGFGKGYYDRFFEKYKKVVKIAPLYEFQLFDSIPSEKHDILMDILLLKNNYVVINNY